MQKGAKVDGSKGTAYCAARRKFKQPRARFTWKLGQTHHFFYLMGARKDKRTHVMGISPIQKLRLFDSTTKAAEGDIFYGNIFYAYLDSVFANQGDSLF